MSAITHSPAPWTMASEDGRICKVRDDQDELVATVWCGDTLADARLISAAPELLAALKAVVAVADRDTDEFNTAREVIHRAEGAP